MSRETLERIIGRAAMDSDFRREMFEQPAVIAETLEGRIHKGRLLEESFGHDATELLDKTKSVQIIACGTSYHAGLVARYWLEEVGIKPDGSWLVHRVKGAKIISPDGSTLCIDERIAGKEVGMVIERDLFDKELAKDAARAGADIMVKTSAIGLLWMIIKLWVLRQSIWETSLTSTPTLWWGPTDLNPR